MNKQDAVKKYIIPNYWILILGLGGFILGIILISNSMYDIGSVSYTHLTLPTKA